MDPNCIKCVCPCKSLSQSVYRGRGDSITKPYNSLKMRKSAIRWELWWQQRLTQAKSIRAIRENGARQLRRASTWRRLGWRPDVSFNGHQRECPPQEPKTWLQAQDTLYICQGQHSGGVKCTAWHTTLSRRIHPGPARPKQIITFSRTWKEITGFTCLYMGTRHKPRYKYTGVIQSLICHAPIRQFPFSSKH